MRVPIAISTASSAQCMAAARASQEPRVSTFTRKLLIADRTSLSVTSPNVARSSQRKETSLSTSEPTLETNLTRAKSAVRSLLQSVIICKLTYIQVTAKTMREDTARINPTNAGIALLSTIASTSLSNIQLQNTLWTPKRGKILRIVESRATRVTRHLLIAKTHSGLTQLLCLSLLEGSNLEPDESTPVPQDCWRQRLSSSASLSNLRSSQIHRLPKDLSDSRSEKSISASWTTNKSTASSLRRPLPFPSHKERVLLQLRSTVSDRATLKAPDAPLGSLLSSRSTLTISSPKNTPTSLKRDSATTETSSHLMTIL